MTSYHLEFTVWGKPIPQGSKTAGQRDSGRPYVRDANAMTLKPWRKHAAATATEAARGLDTLPGAIQTRLTFSVNRPRNHYRTGRYSHLLRTDAPRYPTSKRHGDADKLTRAILDALTDAGVWNDDSQVVDLRVRKVWCGEHELALPSPGVRVRVAGLPTN